MGTGSTAFLNNTDFSDNTELWAKKPRQLMIIALIQELKVHI